METTCRHCGQTQHYCVKCGEPLTAEQPPMIGRSRPSGRGWSAMRLLQSTTPWSGNSAVPPNNSGYTAFRKTPARSPSVTADVATPVAKGLAVGLAAGVLTVLPAALLEGWPWFTPLMAMSAVAPVAVVGFIFHHQSHLWSYEEITHDAEPLSKVDRSRSNSAPVSLEITHKAENNQFRSMFRFDLPVGMTEADFYIFARGVTEGRRGLAQADWTGAGRPFSRPKFVELLSRLAEARLVEFVDPAAPTVGRRLTVKGRQALLTWVATYERGK